jgi:Ca2+-binding EF-hand superfamily protein
MPFVRRLVDVFDTNCDGTIDFREAVIGLSTFLRGSPEARVAQLFEALDVDGDGKVSRSELQGALHARACLSLRMGACDTPEGMGTVADRILAAGDLDGDGQLSVAEFLTLLEAQPEIQLRFAIAEGARLFNCPGASWKDRKVALELLTSVVDRPHGTREASWSTAGEGLKTDAAVQVLSVPSLSPVAIGEFLGGRDETGFCGKCAAGYFAKMSLEGTTLDVALRIMSKRLCLPREAQQIDRLMYIFSQVYCQTNPNVFVDEDAAYITAFAIVMLNTDAHSPNNKRKMTKGEFVRNVPRVERPLLEAIYDRVVAEEIRLGAAEALGLATEAGLVPRLGELAWGEFSRALDALGGA